MPPPPPDRMVGGILFSSVCPSVANLNIRYNVWTVGDKGLIHTKMYLACILY